MPESRHDDDDGLASEDFRFAEKKRLDHSLSIGQGHILIGLCVITEKWVLCGYNRGVRQFQFEKEKTEDHVVFVVVSTVSCCRRRSQFDAKAE